MTSLNKATTSYGDVDDGGARYSLASYRSKLSAAYLEDSAESSPILNQSTLIPNNIIQLEGPLHDAICIH